MSRSFKRFVLGLLVLGGVGSASAFTLMGPFADWQTFRLGYQVGADLGGPMNFSEGYRWNFNPITYGFSQGFIKTYGQKGIDEVNKAIAMLNNLPAASKMSPTLSEFPLDTRRQNSRAAALNLLDLKSAALGAMIEQLGLADPERFTWCLRSRVTFPGDIIDYAVIMRNFDPVTWAYSKHVNGTLFTYTVIDAYWGPDSSDAVEVLVDPLAPFGTPVASYVSGSIVAYGQFYTGLTRDDVGGLRFLLWKGNQCYETIATNVIAVSGGGPWTPVAGSTNGVGVTNLLVDLAWRGGVEKLTFKQMKNEFGQGAFIAVTNTYTDSYYNPGNGKLVKQKYQRVLTQPDITFDARDIDVNGGGIPLVILRTITEWANNSAANGADAGPGVIGPPVTITFNNVGPFNMNESPGFLDEQNAFAGWLWGSFDGTTNAPYVYSNQYNNNPMPYTAEELENAILNDQN